MTIMLATSFNRAATEHVLATGTEANVNVLTIAESGLHAFMHDTFSVRPADGDSVRYNVAGGYAWVHANEIQRPADTIGADIVYVIESRGTLLDPAQGATPQAFRSVAQFARWQMGGLSTILGGFTAANGLQAYPDGNVHFHGRDVTSCTPKDSTNRWRGPNPNYSMTVDVGDGPAQVEDDSSWGVASATGIDWAVFNTGAFDADYSSLQNWNMTYPSQLIMGNLNAGSFVNGSGLLVVTGDLQTSGLFFQWSGVVLVGGRARFEAQFNFINGAIITGLDEIFPDSSSVSKSEVGKHVGGTDSNFDMRFSQCQVYQALASLTGFRPVAQTTVDNWAAY